MRADLGQIYDDTITVINKLNARDSLLKQDTYYKTVIPHCMWTVKAERNTSSDGTVIIGTVHQVQIPESENYMPYREWKAYGNREEAFTLQPGDYVVKGEVTEYVDASTLKSVLKAYEPDVFPIQLFRDATKDAGFEHSTAGIMRFAEMYYVEG